MIDEIGSTKRVRSKVVPPPRLSIFAGKKVTSYGINDSFTLDKYLYSFQITFPNSN